MGCRARANFVVIDTSAILAILFGEPEIDAFVEAIDRAEVVRLSAATYFEAALVLEGKGDSLQRAALDSLLRESDVVIEPLTFVHAQMAREAYREFGKGFHRARLNFGDCFTYALAKATREPLLFKGNDFSQTDLESAVRPLQ